MPAMSLADICRLCLKQGKNHVSLLQDNFVEMLEALTSIKVSKDDKFSTVMCSSCMSNLKIAYGIQQYIIKTDKKLHEYVTRKENIKVVCSDRCEQSELLVSISIQDSEKSSNEAIKEKTEEIFSCILCSKKFNCEIKYLKHLNYHDTKRCPICKENIPKRKYEKHFLEHPQIICEHCGEFSRNMDAHQLHVRRMHTGEATHICDICGEKLFDSTHFKKHVKTAHLNFKPFMCEICSKSFTGANNLWVHQQSHKEHKFLLSCEFCEKKFKYHKQLRHHLKSDHNVIESMKFYCMYCGKRFATRTAVKIHSSRHKKE